MKVFWFLFILITTIVSCTKVEHHENLYIRGRLLLLDTITQNAMHVPLTNKRVAISENNGDTLNYLYSDTTDNDGYFLFDLINDGKKDFVIRYEERINTFLYTGKKSVANGENNIIVSVVLDTVKQNGFVAYVKDSLGGTIPGATILMYTSLVLADLNDPKGAIETLTASSTGKVFKLNLPVGSYYLNTKKQINDSLSFERIKKKVDIEPFGIKFSDSIMVLKKR